MQNTKGKNENITIVCVTAQFECGWLIKEGRKIADMTNTSLYVVDVEPKSDWGKRFRKELDYLFTTSKKLDAKMLVFFSDNPIVIINDYIERIGVKHIVLGSNEIDINNFIEKIHIRSKEVEIHICKYQ